MAKAKVYNMSGKELREIELPDYFDIEPNMPVLHAYVKNYLANQRQGTQSALTRAEVSGGGKKPWRQKGTGRARHGSTRAPDFTHGGVVFAPKPRDYRYSLNKKVRRLALWSALSKVAEKNQVIVVDKLELAETKTKAFVSFLNAVGLTGKKVLAVTPGKNDNIVRSARNIPGVATTTADILSPYDILKYGTFVVDEAALARITEVYGE
ncbi:MAG: 50S ribosomal protein L4 [Oscillospiraceae bacterium]|jgi:large subunit ribosomal protein L4|nr:50S ribosomal protein L4 [Oscillospiraceae bacterium]